MKEVGSLLSRRWLKQGLAATATLVFGLAYAEATQAQQKTLPPVHYVLGADMPPGLIGSSRLQRGGPVHGYFQSVEITGPEGLQVALAQDGQFLPLLEAPVRAGFLIGQVYRIRVSNIPGFPGEEVFPTIEVIDRLYAPPGRDHRIPVPIVLELEDITAALRGELVNRVIYLEDSELAPPVQDGPGDQRVTDVGGSDDPLRIADQLGRPVAIVRLGSRLPPSSGDLSAFLFGCPVWAPIKPIPERQKLIDNGLWPVVEPNADGSSDKSAETVPDSLNGSQRANTARQGGATIRG